MKKLLNEMHIILCKKKPDALLEITLPQNANIHAKEYRLCLFDKEELKRELLEWVKDAEAAAGDNEV